MNKAEYEEMLDEAVDNGTLTDEEAREELWWFCFEGKQDE